MSGKFKKKLCRTLFDICSVISESCANQQSKSLGEEFFSRDGPWYWHSYSPLLFQSLYRVPRTRLLLNSLWLLSCLLYPAFNVGKNNKHHSISMNNHRASCGSINTFTFWDQRERTPLRKRPIYNIKIRVYEKSNSHFLILIVWNRERKLRSLKFYFKTIRY